MRLVATRNHLSLRIVLAAAVLLFAAPAQAMLSVKDTSVEGVTTWYAEDQTLPVVHVILTFTSAGSASDPASFGGRAVMAANLLSEGAGEMDALAFHQALESKAIRFSASAERDDLVVSIHCLESELDEAVRLVTLALSKPRFDGAALATAKAEQVTGWRAKRESPAAIAALAWGGAMYGSHPYGRDALGDPESIGRMTAADLEAYRARYITRANMRIAAAGAVSRGRLKDALSPLVEALPAEFFPERDLPGATLTGKGGLKRIAHAGPQSVVVFGGPGISRKDKRYYAYALMNRALGGGSLSSRLMREVRVKQGLVYSIGTWLASGDAADSFAGQFATRNASVGQAIEAVKQSVQLLAEKGLSERECSEVKREMVASFMLELDSTRSIAQVIATMMRYDLGRDYLEKRAKLFESVRCEDIQNAARQMLKPEDWLFVVVGTEATAPATPPAE